MTQRIVSVEVLITPNQFLYIYLHCPLYFWLSFNIWGCSRYSEKIEIGLFVSRYTMSLLLFGLGLRAPGVVTAQDYMNLNNSFQSPPDPSQVSLLILLTPNQ